MKTYAHVLPALRQGCATRMLTGALLPPLRNGALVQTRIEDVAQTVAEEIETEDGQKDRCAGEADDPGLLRRYSRPSATIRPQSGSPG
jgi:hypothetical protein